MASSTTNLDEIAQAQASKEVTANAFFDAASPSTFFGRRQSTTSGLTWGVYGGVVDIDGVLTVKANTTLTLTASSTNYVEVDRSGVVSFNTTSFTAGKTPLYSVVTGTSTISSYTDYRVGITKIGKLSLSVAGSSNVTLTEAQSKNDIFEFTGALTGSINVYVPLAVQQWTVHNNTTGSFTLTVIGATGTGVLIPQGRKDIIYSDGTNVNQLNIPVTKSIQIANANLGFGTTPPTQAVIGNYNGWAYTIADDTVFTFHIPEDWKSGTDIVVNYDWAINEAYATANGEVRFKIVYSSIPHDSTEAISGAGTTVNGADINIPATAYFLTTNSLTIANADLAAGDQVGVTLSRIALVGGVDPTAEPAIIDLHITYTSDK